MRPPEVVVRRLVAVWIKKADLDFDTVEHLAGEERFRDVVAFHAQQAAEKYVKAILTRHQIEFPKTHLIEQLLILLSQAEPQLAHALDTAQWLSPFGVDMRYPGDRPDTLPGDEVRALALTRLVRERVMALLNPYLAAEDTHPL